nr:MAG TPA: hypothetical protein [Caudoviricetes sp.]
MIFNSCLHIYEVPTLASGYLHQSRRHHIE